MKCIVGLGNPGSRYRMTRHNIGFLLIEFLIRKQNARHTGSTELYESYQFVNNESDVLLVLPQTYMNNSGVAIREIQRQYSLAASDILVAYDDFQIPYGTLRLRPKGSDGGHNGIASIIDHLQTDLVPRLRIGVGGTTLPEQHTHESMADYVLSSFDNEEEKLLPQLLQHAHDACKSWIESGIQKTMSQYNKNFFNPASAG